MFLVSVPVPFPSSAARDAARDHPSSSTVALLPKKKHSSTAEVRHQPHTLGPQATSSKPSRVSPPAIFAMSQLAIGFSVADILDSVKFYGSSDHMISPVCKVSQIYDRPPMEILLFLQHGQFAWVHGVLLFPAQHYGTRCQ